MSLLDKIAGWFQSGGAAGRADRLYILDGTTFLSSRGGGRTSPREIMGLLHRLSQFAQAEKIQLHVVFPGESLRKAPDGAEFNGVDVYYADDAVQLKARVLELLRKGLRRKGGVAVISADAELEKAAAKAGGHTLRASTFRKALDGVDSGGGQDRGPRGGGGGGGGRERERRRRPRRSGPPRGPGGSDEGSSDEGGGEPTQADSVRSLIDLVE